MATAAGYSSGNGRSASVLVEPDDVDPEEDHELQYAGHESGPEYKDFDKCTKNPGHKDMVLVKDLTLEHFPENWRYPNLLPEVLKFSREVVKLTVRYVSPNRPKTFPSYRFRGKNFISVGSGKIDFDPELRNMVSIDCPIKDCTKPKPCKTTPLFKVATCNHVVYDDSEAEKTTVEFFFDSEEDMDRNVVSCQGVKVLGSSQNGDACYLLCVSHDLDLFKKVEVLPLYPSLLSAAHAPIPQQRPEDPLVVIVSHPHGHFKYVSMGEWIGYRKFESRLPPLRLQDFLTVMGLSPSELREKGLSKEGEHFSREEMQGIMSQLDKNPDLLLSDVGKPEGGEPPMCDYIAYTAATCPGSSGAHLKVFLPGRHDKPWILAGASIHLKRFKDMNRSGNVTFLAQHKEEYALAISERQRIVRKGMETVEDDDIPTCYLD